MEWQQRAGFRDIFLNITHEFDNKMKPMRPSTQEFSILLTFYTRYKTIEGEFLLL